MARLVGQMEAAFGTRGRLQSLPDCARPERSFADTPSIWFSQPVPGVNWLALEVEARATFGDFDALLAVFQCMFLFKERVALLREDLRGLSASEETSKQRERRTAEAIHHFLSNISRIALRGRVYPVEVSPLWGVGGGCKRNAECVCGPYVYHLKYRAQDIALSRGDLADDMSMAADCSYSGYTPRLLIFDETPSPLRDWLESTCRDHGGEVFLGEAAWAHVTEQASPIVRTCIERYCRDPLALVAAEQSGAA
ncbi:MAG: hypothetical protein CMH88_14955 [Oceanibulbus sp.]|jgi:hypothetical protein|nr:hypothetical protein [Sulfitobacter sp.]|tara:strand:+ start:332 stop:1090 length:759 start_codon:yes stop_codon:yes gene_type:complete